MKVDRTPPGDNSVVNAPPEPSLDDMKRFLADRFGSIAGLEPLGGGLVMVLR